MEARTLLRLALALALGLCATTAATSGRHLSADGCPTPLDLIASQNPNLPLHPVFQDILNSPKLRGTIFIPTGKAWKTFFDTVRQRQGKPEAAAMIAAYGQILLYHLAQDVTVPISTPTPGANRFAVATAGTLQCTFGPGLPNNRLIVNKTPSAIYIQHGFGNATILSQAKSYCGGEAYLVDQVLIPCSDVSAIMGEIANVPQPCKNNVQSVLLGQGLSYYNALMLATGVSKPVFAAVRNYTIFAPSDAAVQAASDSGMLDYANLFATNKDKLVGVVAYHAVPQFAYAEPSRFTASMEPLLSVDDLGKVDCPDPRISWRADGNVYGGSGVAQVTGPGQQGCQAIVLPINQVLQPCCKTSAELLASVGSGAIAGSFRAKQLDFLKNTAKGGTGSRTTYIIPSDAAWQQLLKDVGRARKNFTDAQLNLLFKYMLTKNEVSDRTLALGNPTVSTLALEPFKLVNGLCPTGTNSTLLFVALSPTPGAGEGAAEESAAAGAALGGPVVGYPATAAATPSSVSLLNSGTKRRRLQQAGGDASRILPTTFQDQLAAVATAAPGLTPATSAADLTISSPVAIVDGLALDLGASMAIPVQVAKFSCDANMFLVDTVPLPCNFLNKTLASPPPSFPPPAFPPPARPIMIGQAANASGFEVPPAAAATPESPAPKASGAVRAAAPFVASAAAGVLLALVLLA